MGEEHRRGRAAPEKLADEMNSLLGEPRVMMCRGQKRDFYTIGALARALNRSVVTIRKWQDKGFMPKPTFIAPTEALGGGIRLYTREQISGLRKIAADEGLLDDLTRAVTQTNFIDRAFALFEELARSPA